MSKNFFIRPLRLGKNKLESLSNTIFKSGKTTRTNQTVPVYG